MLRRWFVVASLLAFLFGTPETVRSSPEVSPTGTKGAGNQHYVEATEEKKEKKVKKPASPKSRKKPKAKKPKRKTWTKKVKPNKPTPKTIEARETSEALEVTEAPDVKDGTLLEESPTSISAELEATMAPLEEQAVTSTAEGREDAWPTQERPEVPPKGSSPTPVVKPELTMETHASFEDSPKPVSQAIASRMDRNFYLELAGGFLLPRSMRVNPGGRLGFGYNLGSLIGWKGLLIGIQLDTVFGTTQLYQNPYLQFDSILNLRGRFGLGPFGMTLGLGGGLRHMLVLSDPDQKERSNRTGGGAVLMLGLDWPATEFLAINLQGDARYMQEPLLSRFHFSTMVVAGVSFFF